GPSPAAPDFPSRRCASRRPIFASTGYRPRACDALVVFVEACLRGAGKAVVGCAPAATYAAPSSAELMAACAQRTLRPHARCDCSSAANEVSVASFATGHEIEQRREPLAQRGAAASERRRTPERGFASPDVMGLKRRAPELL